jgi:hypothetical protein
VIFGRGQPNCWEIPLPKLLASGWHFGLNTSRTDSGSPGFAVGKECGLSAVNHGIQGLNNTSIKV